MNKAQLVSTINELALRHDLPLVTTRPKKSVLETVLKEYMDVDKANLLDAMPEEYILPEPPIEKDRLWEALGVIAIVLFLVFGMIYWLS